MDASIALLVLDSLTTPVVILDRDFGIRAFNRAFRSLAPNAAIAVRQPFVVLSGSLWGTRGIRSFLKQISISPNGSSFRIDSPRRGGKAFIVFGSPIVSDGESLLLLTFEDVTLQRRDEVLRTKEKETLKAELLAHARKLHEIEGELRGSGTRLGRGSKSAVSH